MICCRSRMKDSPGSQSVHGPWGLTMKNAHLLVLEPHKNNFLHQRQFGLFIPLRALANVPGVKRNLVAILRALVGGFWRAVVWPPRGWRGDPTAFVFSIIGSSGSSSPARETRCRRSHLVELMCGREPLLIL